MIIGRQVKRRGTKVDADQRMNRTFPDNSPLFCKNKVNYFRIIGNQIIFGAFHLKPF